MPHTNEEIMKRFDERYKRKMLGETLGYDIAHQKDLKHFINQEISDLKKSIREEIEIVNKNYRCMACDEKVSNLSHTLQCKYKDEILSIKPLE